MAEETKKLNEIKREEEFMLTDNLSVMAIMGIPAVELSEDTIISRKMGEYRKIDKKKLQLSFLGKETIIFPTGTKISKELYDKAVETAKAWQFGTDTDRIEFYECWEAKKFRKDYPVMIVIDASMCFLIAPRVESE